MSDRFEPGENEKAREEGEIPSAEEISASDGAVLAGEKTAEGAETSAGKNPATEGGRSAGKNPAADGGTSAGENPAADGGTSAGERPPYEGMTSEKEEGDTIEVEKISPGEVDERISSYVKEHIRNDGRQRRNSAFRILFFAVLITIVVFFFVDYVLMKKQLVSGWFAQKSSTEEGNGIRETEDGETGDASADDSQTEPTPAAAGEDATDSEENNQEMSGKDAQTGDGSASASESGEEGVSGENNRTEEGTNEMDSSGETETTEDPARAMAQYLVYIEVTDSADGVSAQAEDAGNVASGQQSVRQTTQTKLPGQSDDESETATEGESAGEYGQTHETTGVIVEIGQSALRVLTDYSSVEYAEMIEITLNGGETTQAQVETADANTGLALLVVSVSELSNETLKEIRMATWGDTSEIEVGTGLTLVTAGGQTGTEKVSSALEEIGDFTGTENRDSAETEDDSGTSISLIEITILSAGEKKQPDAVFTTYSFAASVEGCRILADENGDIVAIGTGAADSIGNTETENDIAIAVAYRVDDLRIYIEKMVDGEAIPYVGISGVTVTDEIKESVSLDMPYGVYVWLADTGSPAYQAGILNGDIITAINGVEVATVQEMRDAILGLEAGVEASFTLMRQGGSTYREYTIKVTPEAVETVLNSELKN